MNNTAFRRLVLDTPSRSNVVQSSDETRASTSLGSRMRSSVPMTPRSVAGSSTNDFARQLAQRNSEHGTNQAKKFRSSTAPKGTRLANGYQDRTKLRDELNSDDKAQRVQALEEMVKLGQMDETTFLKLRDEIVGGDIKNVHLVKGLDFNLLRKMRAGSSLQESDPSDEIMGADVSTEVELEEELEQVEARAVVPVAKEEKVKQGVMAPPASNNRDEILRRLREARTVTAFESRESKPALGSKFKKVGERRESSRIEHDEHGREVLILVSADGTVKRKVKKSSAVSEESSIKAALPAPDKNIAPLGMQVPEPKKLPTPPPAEDLDIFDGVGADFNPLGEDGRLEDERSTSESDTEFDEDGGNDSTRMQHPRPKTEIPFINGTSTEKRNYFNDEPALKDQTSHIGNPLQDPTIRAALKRAADIQAKSATSSTEAESDEKTQRRKRLLDTHDRDAEDMDLGFGGSRMADGEDFDDNKRVKLSVWGEEDKTEQKGGKGNKQPRKRGQKQKKKGDSNNMADVMKVIERRKGQT